MTLSELIAFLTLPAFSWSLFAIVVSSLLILDLGVFHRKNTTQSMKEAVLWSLFWIGCGLAFSAYIFYSRGHAAGAEYLTAYVVEKSLSVDNLFIFLVIFTSIKIEMKYQHRLLFWGIVGAIVLRGIMIFAGIRLIELFHPILYFFGAFLVWTGIGLLRTHDKDAFDPEKTLVFKWFKRLVPMNMNAPASRFMVRDKKSSIGVAFTKAFLALALIESSDVLFALDSVPAVLGISKDPYIVYTSNIFAILGLRSLFFVLESLLQKFRFLSYGISAVLIFVGIKMIIEPWVHIGSGVNLIVIGSLLLLSGLVSLRYPHKKPKNKLI